MPVDPIPNPYKHVPYLDRDKLYTRVDPTDYRWLIRLVPYTKNIVSNIQATLFKNFIDELRRIDSITPIRPALYPDDPTYTLVKTVLGGCNFGRHSGSPSGPDDTGGASSLHPTLLDSPVIEPVTSSRPPRRRRSKKDA